MATVFGVNATKRLNQSVVDLVLQSQHGGRVKSLYDIYTLTADLALGDIIKIGRLPAGARVTDVRMIFGALGGSGAVNVGWQQGAQNALNTANGEAANTSGFGAAVAVSSAGVYSMFTSQSTAAGMQKVFAEEVEVVITTSTDTTASSGSISVEVFFEID